MHKPFDHRWTIPMRHSIRQVSPFPFRGVNHAQSRGFTLIELIVTVSILAIVAAVAIPGFQNLIQTNRVATQTNNFVSSIKLARSEAVKQGQSVTMTAVGGDFANGWCIYEGAAGNACSAVDPIRQFEAPTGITFDTGGDNAFQFDGQGQLEQPNNAVTINVDPKNCDGAADRRRIVGISVVGRPSLNQGNCN